MGKVTEKDIEDCRDILAHIDEMEAKLYEDEPCGGPLHIVTDDGNLTDGNLLFCYRYLCDDGCKCSRITKAICFELLHWLSDVTEAQRVIWWHCKCREDQAELFARARAADVTYDFEECTVEVSVEEDGAKTVLFSNMIGMQT